MVTLAVLSATADTVALIPAGAESAVVSAEEVYQVTVPIVPAGILAVSAEMVALSVRPFVIITDFAARVTVAVPEAEPEARLVQQTATMGNATVNAMEDHSAIRLIIEPSLVEFIFAALRGGSIRMRPHFDRVPSDSPILPSPKELDKDPSSQYDGPRGSP